MQNSTQICNYFGYCGNNLFVYLCLAYKKSAKKSLISSLTKGYAWFSRKNAYSRNVEICSPDPWDKLTASLLFTT